MLFVAFIDTSIPFHSIVYIVFLEMIMFLLFIYIRYHFETKFYRNLQEREHDLDITGLSQAESPFERIVEESITKQTEHLKQIAATNRILLQREKDDLLAWIHEVKRPLTAMRLMLDRVEDRKLRTALLYEWLRMHHLLDQQLHQKRMVFMENDLYIEHVSFQPIVTQEIKPLQSWCIEKGIGFEVQLAVTEVLADAKWLAFIVRQLLTNAVKYSEHNDIMIRSYESNHHVHLAVQDFGRGIDPQDMPRIFEKGFTSTTSHSDNSATGMGLYLAHNVSEALGIHIHAESTPQEGSTFILTFPRKNDFDHTISM